jgi:hypothetical protein
MTRASTSRSIKCTIAAFAVLLAVLGAGVAPALAQGPRWQLSSWGEPTNLPSGGEAQIAVLAWNLGDTASTTESAVTISDQLPAGLTATAIRSHTFLQGIEFFGAQEPMKCSLSPEPSCVWSKARSLVGEELTPYGILEMTITVKVNAAPGLVTNEARIEGGEAPSASVSQPLRVSGTPAPFGIERYELLPENEDGSRDTQAGAHPFALTTTLELNTTFEAGVTKPEALPKDLRVNLPPGLIGNPDAVPQCTAAEFEHVVQEGNLCPADSAVGVVATTIREPGRKFGQPNEQVTRVEPLFNLTPAPGEPARLGFIGVVFPIVLDTSLRTGGDYGVTVSSSNILQTAELLSSRVTVWGVPGDPRHDASRGWGCLDRFLALREPCSPSQGSTAPFLTMPTSCGGPLVSSAEGDSWAAPGQASDVAEPASYTLKDELGRAAALSGCGQLPFDPSLSVAPETHAASTPTGLNVEVHVPQETTLSANGLAEADVRDTTVALPQGVLVSPSSANGRQTCSEEQIGFERTDATGTNLFSSTLPEPFCPNAAKVGNVRIKTPLLPRELEGGVYLATQNANPFSSLLALYIVAQDPVSGVLVKLAGAVHLDETTGQLVSSFTNTPQLPFEDLKLEFFGGQTGPVSTPPSCGSYTTTSSFTPWSGEGAASPSSTFAVTSGAGGGACPPTPPAFEPSFSAGSTNLLAGAFTPFEVTIGRPDGDQALRSLNMRLPGGLAAMLSSVTPCEEPRVVENTCGAESLIGYSTASAGLGGQPYSLPGQVFLTGPYEGAPFGLSAVTPAVAGPFNLGVVTVRSTINVNPETAAVTIASDPFPTFLQGIPVQLKQIRVVVNRPGFQFNPTSCSRMKIEGALSGAQGGVASVSSPFQVADCASLPFKPKLTASSGGRGSKLDGTSFKVEIDSGGLGQANIAKVELQLPLQLPSRLATLQKACPDHVFEIDPASCDGGSVIGTATIHTPVLRSPLSGPAYLVSHGGAAFPDVELVLQGEGIKLVLDGKTDIKKGITYSRFESAPDAPFTRFETTLPAGPHSALGVNVPAARRFSLCGQSLLMPTVITGQNGIVIKQKTRIAISGCPRHVVKRRARHSRVSSTRAPARREPPPRFRGTAPARNK